nr:DNA repair protein RAD4 isoform X1 [Tanacetum cinerariifolium]
MQKQRRVEEILRSQEWAIHGDKSQGERDWVMNQFRSGKSPILVATNFATQELDVKDVRFVSMLRCCLYKTDAGKFEDVLFYYSGENSTGKWVHVDVVNAIIDGEHDVEAANAACKTSLRYVVAFAGRGAKDVTQNCTCDKGSYIVFA